MASEYRSKHNYLHQVLVHFTQALPGASYTSCHPAGVMTLWHCHWLGICAAELVTFTSWKHARHPRPSHTLPKGAKVKLPNICCYYYSWTECFSETSAELQL